VALAAALASLAAVVVLAASGMGASPVLLGWVAGFYIAILPLAIGAAVVLGLGQLLGRDSSLVVAAATLVVATVFQPARRRIQALADRRFNRRRYDAARTIAAFSGRLREQVDLDTLSGELLMVVEQTMQPTLASLWLRQAALPAVGGPAHGPPASVE
jgi:hypothetical protein